MTILLLIGRAGEVHVLYGQGSAHDLLEKLSARQMTQQPTLDATLTLLGYFDPASNWCCRTNGSEMILIYPEQASPPSGVNDQINTLSPRQRQVLQHLSEGLTTKQIARQLGVQPTTVSMHIRMLKQRLGATTRAEFVGKAARVGLCQPPPNGG
jgi:DNA-binding CsgD family transcriptional regulator